MTAPIAMSDARARLRELAPPAWAQQFAEAREAGAPVDDLVALAIDRSITSTADEELALEGFPIENDISIVLPIEKARRLLAHLGGSGGIASILNGEISPCAVTILREHEGAISSEVSAITFPRRIP